MQRKVFVNHDDDEDDETVTCGGLPVAYLTHAWVNGDDYLWLGWEHSMGIDGGRSLVWDKHDPS